MKLSKIRFQSQNSRGQLHSLQLHANRPLVVEFDGDGDGVLVYPLVLELEGLHANVDDSSSKISLIVNDIKSLLA